MAENTTKLYVKQQSFERFVSLNGSDPVSQKQRVLKFLTALPNRALADPYQLSIIEAIIKDLTKTHPEIHDFKINMLVADELAKLPDEQLVRYLIHRYRYDIYPQKKVLDDYPPYLQIEPSSI